MKTLRTPLSVAKGLGSAKEGTDHFWSQRLSALALIPLTLWLCFSIAALPGMDYASIRDWLASPFTAIMMILLIITGFHHSRLGLRVIIEDYVSSHTTRTIAIITTTLATWIFTVIGVFSVMRVAFTG